VRKDAKHDGIDLFCGVHLRGSGVMSVN
jgi:hypothetical protein